MHLSHLHLMSRRERNKTLARLAIYARHLLYLCELPGPCAEKFAFKSAAWENTCRVLADKIGRNFEVDRVNHQTVIELAEHHQIIVVPVRKGVPVRPWERPTDWKAELQARRRERVEGALHV